MGLLYSVYVHTAPNGKKYVGITSREPEQRWKHGRGYSQNKHFASAINKYGWDNINHKIVVSGVSKETACKMEQALIAEYKSNDPRFGYNNSIGGENPNEGHRANEAEIKHRSETHKGIKMSEQGKKNISNAKKGKPNGKKGMFGANGTRALLIYQIDPTTSKVVGVFYGYAEMSRETGFAISPVKRAANGTQKQSYGFLWTARKKGDTNVVV